MEEGDTCVWSVRGAGGGGGKVGVRGFEAGEVKASILVKNYKIWRKNQKFE